MDTRRPALTPGGGPGPGPRRGRRCGAVPRKGLQGPRTKRPHWGRRASGRRRGREITFWGPLGCSLSARSLFRGDPPLAKGGCWSPTQRPPPPAKGSTFVPLSPQLHWAGQGTRLPSARLQHKARPGEGKSHSGVHSRGSRSPPWPCPAPPAPLSGQHNFSSPKVGFLRGSGVPGPTSRNLPLPALPSSLRAADGKPRIPPPRPPRPPRSPGPGSSANAPAPLLPNLPEPKGPGARARRVCGWPRSPHLPGSPAGTPAAAVPGVTGWELATPGAAAG